MTEEEKRINRERAQMKRRRVPRKILEKNIGLLVKGQYFVTTIHEIGEGGCLVSCPQPLKVGQKAVLTLRLFGQVNGVIYGSVVYALQPKTGTQDQPKYGLQFDAIDFDLKRKIRNFVASNIGKQVARQA